MLLGSCGLGQAWAECVSCCFKALEREFYKLEAL